MSCIIFRAWNNVSDIAKTTTEGVIYDDPLIDMSSIIFRAWNNVSDIASTTTEVVIYEEPLIDMSCIFSEPGTMYQTSLVLRQR